jgi:hypothetical protein
MRDNVADYLPQKVRAKSGRINQHRRFLNEVSAKFLLHCTP